MSIRSYKRYFHLWYNHVIAKTHIFMKKSKNQLKPPITELKKAVGILHEFPASYSSNRKHVCIVTYIVLKVKQLLHNHIRRTIIS